MLSLVVIVESDILVIGIFYSAAWSGVLILDVHVLMFFNAGIAVKVCSPNFFTSVSTYSWLCLRLNEENRMSFLEFDS